MNQEQLSFIISQPRSGSTLLQQILDSHSKIYSPPEPWLILPLSIIRKHNYKVEYASDHSGTAINQFLNRIPNGDEIFKQACRQFVLYIYDKALKQVNKKIFIDKTPRYYYILDFLSNIFPDSKFIVLLRHPLDIFVSLRDTFYGGNNQMTLNQSGDSIIGAQKIAQFLDKKIKNRKIVRYEELVKSPFQIIKDLCLFLGVDYEDNMINYGDFKHNYGFGDPKIKKYKFPHSKSINQWKIKLPINIKNMIINHIGVDIIKKLGYII